QAMPVITWIQRTTRSTQCATIGSHTLASMTPLSSPSDAQRRSDARRAAGWTGRRRPLRGHARAPSAPSERRARPRVAAMHGIGAVDVRAPGRAGSAGVRTSGRAAVVRVRAGGRAGPAGVRAGGRTGIVSVRANGRAKLANLWASGRTGV